MFHRLLVPLQVADQALFLLFYALVKIYEDIPVAKKNLVNILVSRKEEFTGSTK